ncbi:ComEA family DNA-binding protein [Microbacterium sp. Gd 4-13]|uniref:ComEA family DNA-binding protein n=1 Tax=Microbacterium sp. Gd 4-13 TaxID=2173179 RepID=UPI001F0CBB52|nr:ComEA family DNA-binding protein [Microbacterium sp. Gd 4-13]
MPEAHDRTASRRLGVGAVVVLLLAGLVITVGIGIARGAGGAGTTTVTPSATAPPGDPADGAVYVHVTGAVAAPGLYRLTVGARVVDAVGSAGGFAEDADRGSVNLARPVTDGEQLVVPVIGAITDEPAQGQPDAALGAVGGLIDLNSADPSVLDTLPRIGPALAERIVAWRDDNGRFTSVDDLLSIPGIGEKIVDGLRALVRV